jgi:S1-C subfamily serine protease
MSRAPAACLLALVVLGSGCMSAPAEDGEAADVSVTSANEARVLSQDSIERAARAVTLRVRNTMCDGLATGSAVSFGGGTIVTNHHVIDEASTIEVQTWDGKTADASVSVAGLDHDIAVLRTNADVPVAPLRTERAEPGESVVLVGFPQGQRLQFWHGVVRDYVDGERFGEGGDVMRMDMRIEPGNSGGPVFDADGHLIGVAFAEELSNNLALAIPTEEVQEAIASPAAAPAPASCRAAPRAIDEPTPVVTMPQTSPAPVEAIDPCPSGLPAINVTGVGVTEGTILGTDITTYSIVARGNVVNDSTAAILVGSLTINFEGIEYPGFAELPTEMLMQPGLAPGASVPWESRPVEAMNRPTGPATATPRIWSWADPAYLTCMPHD